MGGVSGARRVIEALWEKAPPDTEHSEGGGCGGELL